MTLERARSSRSGEAHDCLGYGATMSSITHPLLRSLALACLVVPLTGCVYWQETWRPTGDGLRTGVDVTWVLDRRTATDAGTATDEMAAAANQPIDRSQLSKFLKEMFALRTFELDDDVAVRSKSSETEIALQLRVSGRATAEASTAFGLGGSLTISANPAVSVDGDVVTWHVPITDNIYSVGTFSPAPDIDPDELPRAELRIVAPGRVVAHDGDLRGRTVTWSWSTAQPPDEVMLSWRREDDERRTTLLGIAAVAAIVATGAVLVRSRRAARSGGHRGAGGVAT